MLTFADLWKPVARRIGDVSEGAIRQAKEYINRIARDMAQRATWPHLCDERQLVTTGEYTTGNVDVTNGAYAITGGTSAPVWTREFVNRTFQIDDEDARYRIRTYTSATALSLLEPYRGTTATNQTYEIFADEYQLERDTIGIIRMALPEEDRLLTPGEMHRYYQVRSSVESASTPNTYFAAGATLDPYYSTGTVSCDMGGTTVTGAGTAWDSTMVGRLIRLKDDMPRRMYRISAVGSGTSLTIETPYRGLGGAQYEYEIDPPGIPLVKLYPRPDDAYHIYYWRKRAPRELFEDDEAVPDWPEEFADVLIQGATFLALKEKGDPLMVAEKGEYEKMLSVRIGDAAVTEPNISRQVGVWGSTPRGSSFPGDYPVWLR